LPGTLSPLAPVPFRPPHPVFFCIPPTQERKVEMIEIGNHIAYGLRELSQKLQEFRLGLKYYVMQESVDQYFDIPSWEWEKAQSEIPPRALE